MLGHLKSINHWVIIHSYIKNSTIRVEKSSYVFDHNRRDIFVYDISVIFEFVMPVLYDGQTLTKMEILVVSIPINLFFGLNCL